MWQQVRALIWKELIWEWRQKYALGGILLYATSTVFIVYMAFFEVDAFTWNTLFWIIMLFTSVNAIAKSFIQEGRGRWLYYYTITSPHVVILSKMIYNLLIMIVLSALTLGIYSLMVGNPIKNPMIFGLALLLGAVGLSLTLTLVAAIAAKANNNATLMAILSFPIIIPLLMMLIRLSKASLLPEIDQVAYRDMAVLGAMDVMIITLALILFPYLWRD